MRNITDILIESAVTFILVNDKYDYWNDIYDFNGYNDRLIEFILLS